MVSSSGSHFFGSPFVFHSRTIELQRGDRRSTLHRWGIDLARECLFLVPVPSYASFLFKLSILDPCPTLPTAKNIKNLIFLIRSNSCRSNFVVYYFYIVLSIKILDISFTIFKNINLEKLNICYNVKYFLIEFWLKKKFIYVYLYVHIL